MDSLSSTPTIKIANGAVVCSECELQGDIVIGARTVIHPRAKILALSGPIIIGENNIIEEQVQIINKSDDESSNTLKVMTIGSNNVFEVDCLVESRNIGDNNVVESKGLSRISSFKIIFTYLFSYDFSAHLGNTTSLSNGCVIGAKCEILTNEDFPDGSLFYGSGSEVKRRIQLDKPSAQGAQIEFLSKVLPNYHRIRKPSAIS